MYERLFARKGKGLFFCGYRGAVLMVLRDEARPKLADPLYFDYRRIILITLALRAVTPIRLLQ